MTKSSISDNNDNFIPNQIDILEQDLKDSDNIIKNITKKNQVYKLVIKRNNCLIEYLNNKVDEIERDLEVRDVQLIKSSKIIEELLDQINKLT